MEKLRKKFRVSGRVIAEYRAKKPGLTQDQLAKALKVNRVTFAGWENSVTVLVTEEQLNTLKKELSIPENVITNVELGEHGTEDSVYRNIVGGNKDYVIIPRTMLQEYKFIPAEELTDKKSELARVWQQVDAYIEENKDLRRLLSERSSIKEA